MKYVAFLITNGKHKNIEYRVALIEDMSIPQEPTPEFLSNFSAILWIGLYDLAKVKATEMALQYGCDFKTVDFTDNPKTFYALRKG